MKATIWSDQMLIVNKLMNKMVAFMFIIMLVESSTMSNWLLNMKFTAFENYYAPILARFEIIES